MSDAVYGAIPMHNARGEVRAIAIVDPIDFDWASKYVWHLGGKPGYARRMEVVGRSPLVRRAVYLHREILGLMGHADAPMGDHINRDPLDNRRSNLRPSDAKANAQNRDNTQFKGRAITLPEPQPRECGHCGSVFTPRRKLYFRVYCGSKCQRIACIGAKS